MKKKTDFFFEIENFQTRKFSKSKFTINIFHRTFSSTFFIGKFRRNFSSKFFKSKFFKIDFLHDKIIFFVQDFFYLKVWIVSFDSAGSRTPIWWEYGLLEFYLSVLRIEWIEFVKYFIHCLICKGPTEVWLAIATTDFGEIWDFCQPRENKNTLIFFLYTLFLA